MRATFPIICCLCLTVSGVPAAEVSAPERGWRGIVPLRSTRADVEALLGTGENECKCGYYLDNENVFFVFSSGGCERGRWAVPADTVLSITVNLKQHPSLSDLKLDENTLEKQWVVGNNMMYVNRSQGTSLQVQDGVVTSISYGPSTGDESLKCPNFDDPIVPGDLAKEMVERLRERLRQFMEYARNLEFERLSSLYLPEYARLMFTAKNRNEFGRQWLAEGGHGIGGDYWADVNVSLIMTVDHDKRWGKAYDISVNVKTIEQGEIIDSIRTTRAVIRNGQWYFVDVFRLAPM